MFVLKLSGIQVQTKLNFLFSVNKVSVYIYVVFSIDRIKEILHKNKVKRVSQLAIIPTLFPDCWRSSN